jgi:hypothetical protein
VRPKLCAAVSIHALRMLGQPLSSSDHALLLPQVPDPTTSIDDQQQVTGIESFDSLLQFNVGDTERARIRPLGKFSPLTL